LRRVVVTGVGLTCPVGIGTESSWKALCEGRNGIAPISHFDTEGFACKIAGEVDGFDPLDYVDKRDLRKMGRFIFFALSSSQFAIEASQLEVKPADAERVGVYIGSGIGGFDVIEREHTKLIEGGPRKISPFFIPATIINLASGHVSIRYGAKGPNSAAATACTTGAHAVGDSFKIIQRGDADVMICGGAEAAITPMSIGGFGNMKALSFRNDDPAHACRPWDADRDGFVVGEGAGILVLEELERARARNAPIVAELVGYGMSGDAYHITSPAEHGEGAQRAIRACLADGRIPPEEVGYINAHGTSTPQGDVAETEAVKAVFGDHARKLVFGSTKSMTGHLLGGAGALEFCIALLVTTCGVIPPTINQFTPDPECDLDSAPNEKVERRVAVALSNSFGFGGHNVTLGVRRWVE